MRDHPSQSSGAADVFGVRRVRRINLALQGGGSHGAFTWGVLNRLLEEPRLEFDGISGTSAGALNGAMLAFGLRTGGRDAAKALLERLWRRLRKSQDMGPLGWFWPDMMGRSNSLEGNPIYHGFEFVTRMMSPYQFNPMNVNPLRDMIQGLVDFERLKDPSGPKLFVSATNVTRGRLKVFSGDELSAECLVASGCLPFLFQAVEIDGEYYWDGGYMGNPTLYPLIHDCDAKDVLVIQVTPIARPAVPTTPTAIIDRVNEISFNSTYLRELRAIELINRLIGAGKLTEEEAGMRRIFLHRIEAEADMAELDVSSKLNADWSFLTYLRDLGYDAADRWIDANLDGLGRDSTFEAGPFFV